MLAGWACKAEEDYRGEGEACLDMMVQWCSITMVVVRNKKCQVQDQLELQPPVLQSVRRPELSQQDMREVRWEDDSGVISPSHSQPDVVMSVLVSVSVSALPHHNILLYANVRFGWWSGGWGELEHWWWWWWCWVAALLLCLHHCAEVSHYCPPSTLPHSRQLTVRRARWCLLCTH